MANRFTNKEVTFSHFLQKAKEIWGEDEYDNMCDLLRSNDIDGDMFNAMLDNLLDLYGAKRLEGQQHYVVLPQDVKEK